MKTINTTTMYATFNNFNYFRIIKMKNQKGETKYMVQACYLWIDKLFGFWVDFAKENDTITEAEYQISVIRQNRKIESKRVK